MRYFVAYHSPGMLWRSSDGRVHYLSCDGAWVSSGCTADNASFHEITEAEALGQGWRQDLAKATTVEDCEAASSTWVFQGYSDNMSFDRFLESSRQLEDMTDKPLVNRLITDPKTVKELTQDRLAEDFKPDPNEAFWLDRVRAAKGWLPPLQDAEVEEREQRRMKAEEDADRAQNLAHLEGKAVWLQEDSGDYRKLTCSHPSLEPERRSKPCDGCSDGLALHCRQYGKPTSGCMERATSDQTDGGR